MTDGRQKTLCVDFDGVLHLYASGWKGAHVIPDPPVPGAIEWLTAAVARFRVCIFSSRSHEAMGIAAMQAWLLKHGLSDDVLARIDFPTAKPPAHMSIDDRGFCFDGTWPDLDLVERFKPWNKRPRDDKGPPTLTLDPTKIEEALAYALCADAVDSDAAPCTVHRQVARALLTGEQYSTTDRSGAVLCFLRALGLLSPSARRVFGGDVPPPVPNDERRFAYADVAANLQARADATRERGEKMLAAALYDEARAIEGRITGLPDPRVVRQRLVEEVARTAVEEQRMIAAPTEGLSPLFEQQRDARLAARKRAAKAARDLIAFDDAHKGSTNG